MDRVFSKGVAFIFEGATEKVFYLTLLAHFCKNHIGWTLTREPSAREVFYTLTSERKSIIIKMFTVGTISQIVNADSWFRNFCHKPHPRINWTVFLCYDTDNYVSNITKFFEGDWCELRDSLRKDGASEIIDLAAQADIEDTLLLDIDGVLSFLNLPPCEMPTGKNGKVKMKKLFKMRGRGSAYHEGERAKGLIESLNLDVIIEQSPLNLMKIDDVCFNCDM